MKFPRIVGNIFLLDRHISKGTIIMGIIASVIGTVLPAILEKEYSDPIKGVLYAIILASLIYVIKSIKIIKEFLTIYFFKSISLLVILNLTIGFILGYSLIVISNGNLYGWILAIFWMLSWVIYILVLMSKAIFDYDINKYLKTIKVFAYLRATYFSIYTILLLNQMQKLFVVILQGNYYAILIILILTATITATLIIQFITNLYPYMTGHKNVKNAIELIRLVHTRKRIKLNELKELSNFSNNDFDKIINRLIKYKYVKVENKRVQLGNIYSYVSRK